MESTNSISDDYTEIIRRLPYRLRLAYGVGHVLNDICASMWFTYLLVFFHYVLQFDSLLSGVVLCVGQVADAISTPFVGLQSDKDDGFWLCKYGRRKTWHLLGTICVLFSFSFIFSPCLYCQNSHQWAQIIYYSAFIVIFQFGWACVQISHLSLIPDLTPSEHERTALTAIRYRFTVISNVLIYCITWGILHITSENQDDQIGPKDLYKFKKIVWIGLAIGTITSVIFHIFVHEGANVDTAHVRPIIARRSAKHLLSDIQLYQVAGVYMATRLFTNLSQIYIPLYLHECLNLNAESLAIVPLVMFLSSFFMSIGIEPLNRIYGRKIAYVVGATVGIIGCFWIRFGQGFDYNTYEIYLVAILLGAGGSAMLVTSLGITADLIGPNTESGAFVYGANSFTDKLSNGIAVSIIQALKGPGISQTYFRDILAYVCGGSAVYAVIILLTLQPFKSRLLREPSVYSQMEEEVSSTPTSPTTTHTSPTLIIS